MLPQITDINIKPIISRENSVTCWSEILSQQRKGEKCKERSELVVYLLFYESYLIHARLQEACLIVIFLFRLYANESRLLSEETAIIKPS